MHMRADFQSWQAEQLMLLAKRCPERFAVVWATLCREFPLLPEELALAAVEQGEVSCAECAEYLGVDETEVRRKIERYRATSANFESAVVVDEGTQIARIDDEQVAVWEIVREYRKLGSVERVLEAFHGLSPADLTAALRYAEAHVEEIDRLIELYEDHLRRKRVDQLFAS